MSKSGLTEFQWDRRPWLERVGVHALTGMGSEEVPTDEDERLVFALLEALDFDCWLFGDAPTAPTHDEAVSWLTANRVAIGRMSFRPPSFLGLLSGVFDFLSEPSADTSAGGTP